MEHGIRDQPTDGMGHGFITGAFLAAGAVASWLILFSLIDVPGSTSVFAPILAGPGIVILVIGYLAGLAAATKRSTRRLGFGIVIGVTVAAPVLFMFTWSVLSASFGS
jgi:hypothetical protein